MSKIDPGLVSVGKGPGDHCHQLIRTTAIEMAGSIYDEVMKDNKWYAAWKRSHPGMNAVRLEIAFIEKNWPNLIPDARATLAGMLSQNISDDLKSQIHDALVKDNDLRIARRGKAIAKAGLKVVPNTELN